VKKLKLNEMRQTKYVGVVELANAAAHILAESGLAQERGTVSEVPDERTIRYYLTEGLVPSADEKQGTASVFGYRHLIQLLVVKKLQAEHLPIRKIRELVEGRSERELEKLLGLEGNYTVSNEALSYLERLLTTSAFSTHAPQTIKRSATVSVPLSAAQASPSAPQSSQVSKPGGSWSRIELEPGLELHVLDGYQPPREAKGLRKLAQLVLRVLELHGQKPRK
jgi:DNA-binding transcriptional MerR regulator